MPPPVRQLVQLGARLLGRGAAATAPAAPTVIGTPGIISRTVLPQVRVLARGGPAAKNLAEGLVSVRDLSEQTAESVYRAVRPTVAAFAGADDVALRGALLGTPGTTATPAVAQLLSTVAPFFQRTGRPITDVAAALTQRGALSPRVSGRDLFLATFREGADDLTKALVRERVSPWLDIVRTETPHLTDYAASALQSVLERSGGVTAGDKIFQNLRAFNAATLLGRAVVLNAGQPALSTLVSGFGPGFRQTLTDLATRKGRTAATNFAASIGATLNSTLSEYLRHDLQGGFLTRVAGRVLRGTGFFAVERGNRIFAANLGRNLYQQLTRDAAVGSERATAQLARFGVRAGGGFSPDDEVRFAQRFVRATQFRTTPEELPQAMFDPHYAEFWRTLWQFRTFGLKAAELLYDQVRTDPRSLARLVPLAAAIGLPVQAVRRLTAKPQEPAEALPGGAGRSLPSEAIDAVLALGTLGIIADTFQAAAGGRTGVLEFLGGPTAGLLGEAASGATEALQGRPRQLGLSAARRIPVVGPAVRQEVLRRFPSRERSPLSPQRFRTVPRTPQ